MKVPPGYIAVNTRGGSPDGHNIVKGGGFVGPHDATEMPEGWVLIPAGAVRGFVPHGRLLYNAHSRLVVRGGRVYEMPHQYGNLLDHMSQERAEERLRKLKDLLSRARAVLDGPDTPGGASEPEVNSEPYRQHIRRALQSNPALKAFLFGKPSGAGADRLFDEWVRTTDFARLRRSVDHAILRVGEALDNASDLGSYRASAWREHNVAGNVNAYSGSPVVDALRRHQLFDPVFGLRHGPGGAVLDLDASGEVGGDLRDALEKDHHARDLESAGGMSWVHEAADGEAYSRYARAHTVGGNAPVVLSHGLKGGVLGAGKVPHVVKRDFVTFDSLGNHRVFNRQTEVQDPAAIAPNGDPGERVSYDPVAQQRSAVAGALQSDVSALLSGLRKDTRERVAKALFEAVSAAVDPASRELDDHAGALTKLNNGQDIEPEEAHALRLALARGAQAAAERLQAVLLAAADQERAGVKRDGSLTLPKGSSLYKTLCSLMGLSEDKPSGPIHLNASSGMALLSGLGWAVAELGKGPDRAKVMNVANDAALVMGKVLSSGEGFTIGVVRGGQRETKAFAHQKAFARALRNGLGDDRLVALVAGVADELRNQIASATGPHGGVLDPKPIRDLLAEVTGKKGVVQSPALRELLGHLSKHFGGDLTERESPLLMAVGLLSAAGHSPKVRMALGAGRLDSLAQAVHDYVNRHVIEPTAGDRARDPLGLDRRAQFSSVMREGGLEPIFDDGLFRPRDRADEALASNYFEPLSEGQGLFDGAEVEEDEHYGLYGEPISMLPYSTRALQLAGTNPEEIQSGIHSVLVSSGLAQELQSHGLLGPARDLAESLLLRLGEGQEGRDQRFASPVVDQLYGIELNSQVVPEEQRMLSGGRLPGMDASDVQGLVTVQAKDFFSRMVWAHREGLEAAAEVLIAAAEAVRRQGPAEVGSADEDLALRAAETLRERLSVFAGARDDMAYAEPEARHEVDEIVAGLERAYEEASGLAGDSLVARREGVAKLLERVAGLAVRAAEHTFDLRGLLGEESGVAGHALGDVYTALVALARGFTGEVGGAGGDAPFEDQFGGGAFEDDFGGDALGDYDEGSFGGDGEGEGEAQDEPGKAVGSPFGASGGRLERAVGQVEAMVGHLQRALSGELSSDGKPLRDPYNLAGAKSAIGQLASVAAQAKARLNYRLWLKGREDADPGHVDGPGEAEAKSQKLREAAADYLIARSALNALLHDGEMAERLAASRDALINAPSSVMFSYFPEPEAYAAHTGVGAVMTSELSKNEAEGMQKLRDLAERHGASLIGADKDHDERWGLLPAAARLMAGAVGRAELDAVVALGYRGGLIVAPTGASKTRMQAANEAILHARMLQGDHTLDEAATRAAGGVVRDAIARLLTPESMGGELSAEERRALVEGMARVMANDAGLRERVAQNLGVSPDGVVEALRSDGGNLEALRRALALQVIDYAYAAAFSAGMRGAHRDEEKARDAAKRSAARVVQAYSRAFGVSPFEPKSDEERSAHQAGLAEGRVYVEQAMSQMGARMARALGIKAGYSGLHVQPVNILRSGTMGLPNYFEEMAKMGHAYRVEDGRGNQGVVEITEPVLRKARQVAGRVADFLIGSDSSRQLTDQQRMTLLTEITGKLVGSVGLNYKSMGFRSAAEAMDHVHQAMFSGDRAHINVFSAAFRKFLGRLHGFADDKESARQANRALAAQIGVTLSPQTLRFASPTSSSDDKPKGRDAISLANAASHVLMAMAGHKPAKIRAAEDGEGMAKIADVAERIAADAHEAARRGRMTHGAFSYLNTDDPAFVAAKADEDRAHVLSGRGQLITPYRAATREAITSAAAVPEEIRREIVGDVAAISSAASTQAATRKASAAAIGKGLVDPLSPLGRMSAMPISAVHVDESHLFSKREKRTARSLEHLLRRGSSSLAFAYTATPEPASMTDLVNQLHFLTSTAGTRLAMEQAARPGVYSAAMTPGADDAKGSQMLDYHLGAVEGMYMLTNPVITQVPTAQITRRGEGLEEEVRLHKISAGASRQTFVKPVGYESPLEKAGVEEGMKRLKENDLGAYEHAHRRNQSYIEAGGLPALEVPASRQALEMSDLGQARLNISSNMRQVAGRGGLPVVDYLLRHEPSVPAGDGPISEIREALRRAQGSLAERYNALTGGAALESMQDPKRRKQAEEINRALTLLNRALEDDAVGETIARGLVGAAHWGQRATAGMVDVDENARATAAKQKIANVIDTLATIGSRSGLAMSDSGKSLSMPVSTMLASGGLYRALEDYERAKKGVAPRTALGDTLGAFIHGVINKEENNPVVDDVVKAMVRHLSAGESGLSPLEVGSHGVRYAAEMVSRLFTAITGKDLNALVGSARSADEQESVLRKEIMGQLGGKDGLLKGLVDASARAARHNWLNLGVHNLGVWDSGQGRMVKRDLREVYPEGVKIGEAAATQLASLFVPSHSDFRGVDDGASRPLADDVHRYIVNQKKIADATKNLLADSEDPDERGVGEDAPAEGEGVAPSAETDDAFGDTPQEIIEHAVGHLMPVTTASLAPLVDKRRGRARGNSTRDRLSAFNSLLADGTNGVPQGKGARSRVTAAIYSRVEDGGGSALKALHSAIDALDKRNLTDHPLVRKMLDGDRTAQFARDLGALDPSKGGADKDLWETLRALGAYHQEHNPHVEDLLALSPLHDALGVEDPEASDPQSLERRQVALGAGVLSTVLHDTAAGYTSMAAGLMRPVVERHLAHGRDKSGAFHSNDTRVAAVENELSTFHNAYAGQVEPTSAKHNGRPRARAIIFAQYRDEAKHFIGHLVRSMVDAEPGGASSLLNPNPTGIRRVYHYDNGKQGTMYAVVRSDLERAAYHALRRFAGSEASLVEREGDASKKVGLMEMHFGGKPNDSMMGFYKQVGNLVRFSRKGKSSEITNPAIREGLMKAAQAVADEFNRRSKGGKPLSAEDIAQTAVEIAHDGQAVVGSVHAMSEGISFPDVNCTLLLDSPYTKVAQIVGRGNRADSILSKNVAGMINTATPSGRKRHNKSHQRAIMHFAGEDRAGGNLRAAHQGLARAYALGRQDWAREGLDDIHGTADTPLHDMGYADVDFVSSPRAYRSYMRALRSAVMSGDLDDDLSVENPHDYDQVAANAREALDRLQGVRDGGEVGARRKNLETILKALGELGSGKVGAGGVPTNFGDRMSQRRRWLDGGKAGD